MVALDFLRGSISDPPLPRLLATTTSLTVPHCFQGGGAVCASARREAERARSFFPSAYASLLLAAESFPTIVVVGEKAGAANASLAINVL